LSGESQIREIRENDFREIADLSLELGYEVDMTIIKRQINLIISGIDHHAFVVIKKGKIIGFIHGFIAIRLTASPFLEICGLIVKKDERGKGVGKMLAAHIENSINEITKVRVRCNVLRKSAHNFYKKLNYSEMKTQKIFEKNIEPITRKI